ncbi:hypothetical protein R1flu_004328 [Riccia fluitans]|uniref:Uncharacterized protein n=1 Tax=Riccia fluitans TaxID=41844 RepID=A0ABD1YQY8_9MARC
MFQKAKARRLVASQFPKFGRFKSSTHAKCYGIGPAVDFVMGSMKTYIDGNIKWQLELNRNRIDSSKADSELDTDVNARSSREQGKDRDKYTEGLKNITGEVCGCSSDMKVLIIVAIIIHKDEE